VLLARLMLHFRRSILMMGRVFVFDKGRFGPGLHARMGLEALQTRL